ncbi:MAG: HIT domain-containing protein [Gammaproteobacteria bacterium]|jgi:diadenosine tetraphosphate (Ap4A) HIT family hydrolase|nr:HIT domain-containing protein [Gammaproteobacteria bacterium]MBT7307534.1 HIT domain-containing protein [Gammaproteobacteria bacterium]
MKIHPQLQQDTYTIGKLPLSHCLLMNDRRYRWIILVPEVAEEVREIYQLSAENRQQLLEECCQIQQILQQAFQPEKLNIGALGNLVPQLHLHHIARNSGDPAWPGPVWGHSPAIPYSEVEATTMVATLRHKLKL